METKNEISLRDEIKNRIKGFLPLACFMLKEPDFTEENLANLALWIG